MTNHIVDLKQDLNKKVTAHENRSSRQMRKCFRHMFLKDLKMAFRRWKLNLRGKLIKAITAENAAQKLRKRILRKAFERYRRAIDNDKQSEFASKRSDYFTSVLQSRMKKRCFEAIREFQSAHTIATRYFGKMNGKLGLRQLQDAFRKWKSWKNTEREIMFTNIQGNLRTDNEELSKQIGDHEN